MTLSHAQKRKVPGSKRDWKTTAHAFGLAAFFRFSIIWSVKGYRYDNLTVAGDFQEIITLQNGTGRNLRTAVIKGKSLTCRTYLIYDLLHFTGQDFIAAQREMAQKDFKVLFKGAPPHPPSHSHTKDSHSTGITLLFSNSAWVLLRPTELSTFKELWGGTCDLSSLSEKTRKSNHLQMKLQRQHFLLSYLKTLSVGPVGVSNSRPPASQPGAQPSELPVGGLEEMLAI